MALEYHNYSYGYSESGSVNGSAPTGFSQGDFLIGVGAGVGGTGSSSSPPSGWTLITNKHLSSAFGDCLLNVSYRIAQTGDTNWSWSFGGHGQCISILRYTGQSITDPVPFSGASCGRGSSHPAPSVDYNGVNVGSLALQAVTGYAWYEGLHTIPAALTTRYNKRNVYIQAAGGDKSVSGSGSTGVAGFTVDGTTNWVSTTVVIQAAKTFVPTINIF